MKGGYVIADFKKVDLTSGTEATIEGVYDAIAAAAEYNKPVLVTGLVIGSALYPAMYVDFTISSGTAGAVQTVGAETLTFAVVGEDDGVIVTVS